MGISITQLGLLLTLKEIMKDKKVLAISIQYPPSLNVIKKFSKKHDDILSKSDLKKLENTNNQNFQEILFKNILGAQSIDSIDITDEEGANIVFNMNEDISNSNHSNLLNNYDFVFEGGTMEHISNTSMYLKNIFSLIKKNGYYLPNVPSGGLMEHGFYQFSPTFFADLVFQNKDMLDLIFLGVDIENSRCQGLSLNSFYNQPNFQYPLDFVDEKARNFYLKSFARSTLATGTLINLATTSGYQITTLAIIRKTDEIEINFNFSQYIYRSFSLTNIVGSKSQKISKKNKLIEITSFKKVIKRIILDFPFTSMFKYKLILLIIRVLNLK